MEFVINPVYNALLPQPTPEEENAIEESIKKEGQLLPIIVTRDPKTNKTLILDGHTRYKILKKLGIEPTVEYRTFANSYEEMAFILQTNIPRRHLNDYQKVLSSLPLLDIEAKRAVARKKKGTSVPKDDKGRSAAKVARQIGVKTRTYERLLFIIKNGGDKLNKSVASGVTKPSYAEKQIRKRNKVIEPSSFPPGKYQVAVIDPAWDYSNKVANGPDYPTLVTEKIIDYTDKDGRHITDLFDEDCTLYLWTTGPKMEDAISVRKAWGFKPSTIITWVKVKNGKIKFINGYRIKPAAEFLIIANHGNPETPLPENMPPGVVCAEPTGHSEKPEIFYEIIEKAHPNQNKVELFARKIRKGWDYFGNPLELKPKKRTDGGYIE